MISTQGLSPLMAISLIQRERDVFENDVQRDPVAEREIASFRERIGSIGSVDELVKDYEVFSFVMKSFGLENEIFAKAMMKKILTSDETDRKSLVNKLADPRYKAIHEGLGFGTDGKAGANRFGNPKWVQGMVDRYVDQRLIDTQSQVNPSVGIALAFEQKADSLTSWYKVLADKRMTQFFRTAFGLPDGLGQGDIDAQKKMLEKRMDIAEIQKPEVRQKLIRQYAAIAGAREFATGRPSVLDLFSASASSGTWSMVTLDIDAVSRFSSRAYR